MISNFGGDGILIASAGNVVQSSYIGTDAAGTADGGVQMAIGILVTAANNTIGGTSAGSGNVVSDNKLYGIAIHNSGTSDNLLEGNKIGTDVTGTVALPNATAGIDIYGGPTNNTIGGAATGSGNLISGNTADGLDIGGVATSDNLVEGNKIGVDISGAVALANQIDGVDIYDGANDNTIGGTAQGAGNLISGNTQFGLEINSIDTTDYTSGNVVEGNSIGTDSTGTVAVANGGAGVEIRFGAIDNTIGGTASGAGNLVSGNAETGVSLIGSGTSGNLVAGNEIGTDVSGTIALANGLDGVDISGGATANTIGAAAGGMNVISGNVGWGVWISDSGTTGNLVQANYIGTSAHGNAAVANGEGGVDIAGGAQRNTIGGTTADPFAGLGNVISGNNADGVQIQDSGTGFNVVDANLIGTNATGTAALPNANDGVLIKGSDDNTIGGASSGSGNVISGNASSGIQISGSGAIHNVIAGNFIGTDVTGTLAIANAVGIELDTSPRADTIGGTAAGAGNVISGNAGDGILFNDFSLGGIVVAGNLIGTASDGSSPLGNQGDGVSILAALGADTIGGTAGGSANVIAYNTGNGVTVGYDSVSGDPSTSDAILGNSIYANSKLGIDLGDDGVTLNDSSGHSGPNLFQDFPVLTSVLTSGGTTTITGTLSGAADSTFRIEFFSNPAQDPSGYGQGQTFLMFDNVTTDDSGQASFSVQTPSALALGQYVTATATDPSSNTSEFSADAVVATGNFVSWVNPSGGDWDTPGNWSNDAVPTSSDEVFITIAVSSPITHNTSASDAVQSLTSSDPIVLSAGSLAIGTTAALSASMTFSGGTLSGATIDLSGGATLLATAAGGTLDGVTVEGNIDLTTAQGANLTIEDGLTLDGTAMVGSPSSNMYGYLLFTGSQALGGTGTVVFGQSSFNTLLVSEAGTTLTIGPGITVRGQNGTIGYNNDLINTSTNVSVVNQGTIQADVASGTITIDGTGSANDGELSALDGTTLLILDTLTNSGTVSVDSTSVLSLSGTLTGGTIATQTGAQIYGSTLDGVTIDGNFTVSQDNQITVQDGLTLNGTLTLGAPSSNVFGYLLFSRSQTLGGTGTVVFGQSLVNTLYMSGSAATLTIGPGITVRGQNGTIGYNSSLISGLPTNVAVVNQGTIEADVAGGTITIDGTGGENVATLNALNGATVSLQATNLQDIGTNYADATSAFSLGGSLSNSGNTLALTGPGTFTLSGTIQGGTVSVAAGTSFDDSGTLDGVTLDGNAVVSGNTGATILDGLTLNGTLAVGSPSINLFGYVEFSGTQTLGGTGDGGLSESPIDNALIVSEAEGMVDNRAWRHGARPL